jgi:hypothetical protein
LTKEARLKEEKSAGEGKKEKDRLWETGEMGIENEQVLEGLDGGLARTLKDLFAGAAGGVAQVLLGMSNILPFQESDVCIEHI